MKNTLPFIVIAIVCFAFGAMATEPQAVRLVYSEKSTAQDTTKEYLVEEMPGGGYHIRLFNQGIKREIVCDAQLNTLREVYLHSGNGDRLIMSRRGDALRLTGTLEGKAVDKSFEIDAPWYGSVLLLRDFVLSGEEEILFWVTKPEEEKAVLLKAIREDVETVDVGGAAVEAVRVKYTVPGFKGMFWKSYYWYRTTDGLLVKTEEVRGGPGTPTVYAELLSESPVEMKVVAER